MQQGSNNSSSRTGRTTYHRVGVAGVQTTIAHVARSYPLPPPNDRAPFFAARLCLNYSDHWQCMHKLCSPFLAHRTIRQHCITLPFPLSLSLSRSSTPSICLALTLFLSLSLFVLSWLASYFIFSTIAVLFKTRKKERKKETKTK